MSKEFLKDPTTNRVTGIKTVMVEWNKNEKGQWQMKEVPDSEKTYPCQLVLLAMGFLGPEPYATKELDLVKDPRSNIKTAGDGAYRTSMDKVFAAGDCRRGQSLVVWAISEGRQAAREVDEFLMGESMLPGPGGIIKPKVAHQ